MNQFLRNIKKAILTFILMGCFAVNSMAQKYKVDTLLYNGDINKYINVVILGDGYTAAQMPNFISDATNFLNSFLFSQTPMKQYKKYFNVMAIETPSAQSGIKHPRTASDCTGLPASNPNNFFETSFDIGGIHRLLYPNNSSAVTTVIANNFPSCDQVYMIANSTEYGGGGGDFATFSINASSGEIGLHEGYHSFGGLADEYWAGSQYAKEMPNMTQQTSPTLVKWKNWMNVNGVGIFSHSGDPSWKKPRNGQCKMELLSQPLCSVCSETVVEKIHSLVHPIEMHNPITSSVSINNQQMTFSIKYLTPSPNTMSRRWVLDGSASAKNNVSVFKWTTSGTVLGSNKDSISLNGTTLSMGNHKLKAYVLDTTGLTRSDSHSAAHLDSIVWDVNKTATGIEINKGNDIHLVLYPNPVTNENLTIAYNLQHEDLVTISLLSADGKMVRTFQYRSMMGDNTQSIDMQGLSAGNYFLQLSSDEIFVVKEVVKK